MTSYDIRTNENDAFRFKPSVTTFQIHVTQRKQLDKKRIQIKIAETGIKLDTVNLDGEKYRVVKAMTRGRYIVSPMEVRV